MKIAPLPTPMAICRERHFFGNFGRKGMKIAGQIEAHRSQLSFQRSSLGPITNHQ